MSFRLKITLLVALGVIIAVVPYASLSYREFALASLENEKQHFRILSEVLAEETGAINYSFLTGQVLDIVRQKEALRKISLLYARYLDDLEESEDGEIQGMEERLAARLSELGIKAYSLPVLDDGVNDLEEARAKDPFGENLRDYMGRPLSSWQRLEEISQSGRFSLFEKRLLPEPGDGPGRRAGGKGRRTSGI